MRYRFLIPAVLLVFLFSCKKNDNPGDNDDASSKTDLLADSVYLYTKEVYLWQDVLPSYEAFNPRQYKAADELQSATNVLNAVRKLQPLDRFSFVTTNEESEGLQTGEDKDFGFFIKAAAADLVAPLDSVNWYVTYAYRQSTAGLAGVQRGWYISKINGVPINYSQASVNTLNDVFFGTPSSASFEFTKPDGSTLTVSLSKSSFTANSVLYSDVISSGGKKVGYLVFNQFFGQPSRNELATAFNSFQAQGINELIVDLRYNPGGSVETQDTLANLIAPAAANNQTMYQYIFNPTLQNNQHQLIRKRLGYGNMFAAADNTVKYEKAGAVNLSRVFFIVSSSSASASELLINNLKPYMDVKLIGDTTYGKPVGFFPIPVYDYSIYPISFKTVNSAGNADYYTGFVPDKLSVDGVNRNWGDVNEPSLALALKYINTGSFARTTANERRDESQLKFLRETKATNKKLEEEKFKGMFLERPLK